MKRILQILAVVLLGAVTANAQTPSPGIFNYQGVARNSVGNVLQNKAIALRLTIRDLPVGGTILYQEVRGVTTNPFGLFNVQLGSPGFTSQIGTIPAVNWGVGNKYMQVEIDPNGGSTFINIGSAQIASVPYALYASLANDLVLPFIRTQADNGPLFRLTNSANTSTSSALEGLTNSIQDNVSAVIGTVSTVSAGANSAGVKGINNGNAGNGIGVWGQQNGGGWGVYGFTPLGIGVYGQTTSGTGIRGLSVSGNGVNGITTSGIGVFGTSSSGNAGRFEITNNLNAADALQALTNGTASSWAFRATSTGLQGAGIFTYNNSAGIANALRVTNNGSGATVSATASGSGSAGLFNNTNAANTSPVISVSSNQISGNGILSSMSGTTGPVSAVSGFISSPVATSSGVNGADFSAGGASPIEARTFGVLGQTGTAGIAVGGYALAGGTALRGSGGGATGYALQSTGRVQLAGIGENLNWILRSDAAGNATWANPAVLLSPLFWATTGNTGTVDGINFIGTIDNVPFNIKVNNQKAGRLDGARNNTFLGIESGSANYTTIGSENTGIGTNALNRNTTGDLNTALGSNALYSNTTGSDNTATGRMALYSNTSGRYNSAHGRQALIVNTTGNYNTGNGWDALYNNTTGSNNTATGSFTLSNNTTGSRNTGLGYQADVASGGLTNATAIGANAWVATSNSMVLGSINGVNGATASANVAIGVSSPITRLTVVQGAAGAVTIQDGTQGTGRLFFDNGAGIGTGIWSTPAAANLVSGNGTFCYIPKWTPDGNTIGNSIMFETAGAAIGVGTTTPTHRFDVTHTGSTGIGVNSTAGFSVVDINAASGDAALRFANAGVNQWNTRNRPADNYYEIFELGGGGSRFVIQDGTGNVGIGQTVAPSYKLDVLHGGSTGLRVQSSASFSVVDIDANSGDAALRFVKAGVNQWNTRNRPADDYYEIFELGGGGSRFVIQDGTGNVGIGQTVAPSYKLDVLHGGSTGLRVQSSASFSVVDIDANSGDAALRFVKAGVNQWNTRNRPADDYYEIFELGGGGSRFVIQDGTGNVGIGATASPSYKLDVEHGGSTGARILSTASFSVVDIDGNSGDAALRFVKAGVNKWNTRNEPVADDYQIFELGGGGERVRIQRGSGNVGIGQPAPGYKLDVNHGGATGLRVQSSASFSVVDIDGNSGDAALRFVKAGVNKWNTRNEPAFDDYQIFELGGGGERLRIKRGTGFVGINTPTPSTQLEVVGTITGTVKAFTIDHPLDPANKTLRHISMESPEALSVYSGNVVTDASGKAMVDLPAYFEALNKDFRYQLTVIGAFAQAIISKEIVNNKFEIATNQPNVKVSWQVQGVRNDPYMKNTFNLKMEEEKPASIKGKYYHPESYGLPATMGVNNANDVNVKGTSLEDVRITPAKSAKPEVIKGSSLEQLPIAPSVNKVVDNSGSVADVQPSKVVAKPVDNSGSVAPQTEVKKADVKPVEVKGTSVEDVPNKPVEVKPIEEKKKVADPASTRTE